MISSQTCWPLDQRVICGPNNLATTCTCIQTGNRNCELLCRFVIVETDRCGEWIILTDRVARTFSSVVLCYSDHVPYSTRTTHKTQNPHKNHHFISSPVVSRESINPRQSRQIEWAENKKESFQETVRRSIVQIKTSGETWKNGDILHVICITQTLLSSRLLSKNLKIKIYETIILPVVLYGCEEWSLTLWEDRRRIFGPKTDENGEWRRLHK